MNIVLLGNHAIANAGDRAILDETLAMLVGAFPGADLTLVFNDDGPARAAYPQHTVLASPLRHAVQLEAEGSYRFAARSYRLDLMLSLLVASAALRLGFAPPQRDSDRLELVRALHRADLVLACGGGYIYSAGGDEIVGWFYLMLLPLVLTHILGRSLVLLPQSIGPLHGLRQTLPVAWAVRHARLTLVRERPSLDLLKRLGCGDRAVCVPDLAFGMASAPPDAARAALERAGVPAERAAPLIGVTAIDWAGQNFTFAGQQPYERALTDAIDTLTARGALVALFAQCAGPSAAEDDRLTAAKLRIAALQPERVLLVEPLPPADLQAAYGMIDGLIGTRMHSVILACNAGTPAIAIGYLHKTSGILAELGLERRGLDIASVSGQQIVAALDAAMAEPRLSRGVTRYLERARQLRRDLGALMRGWFASRST